jgi:Exocyst complex component Sec10
VARYISTRPLFANPETLERLAGGPGTAPARGGTGNTTPPLLRSATPDPSAPPSAPLAPRLNPEAFRWLASFLRDEAVVMEQVFVDPGAATAALVHRVFEQTVGELLDEVLQPPAPDAPVEVLRPYLRLLTDAHRRAKALAEEGRSLAGPAVGAPIDLAAAACGAALDTYLAIELTYLADLGGSKVAGSPLGTLSREIVLDLIAMNEEAVGRCVAIAASPEEAAGNVRVLFHSAMTAPGGGGGSFLPGGLLGLVGNHLVVGVADVADAAIRKLGRAFRPGASEAGGHTVRSSALQRLAAPDVGDPVSDVLGVIGEAAACVALVREYYHRAVAPHVVAVPAEEATCVTGMAELLAVMDGRSGGAVRRLMAAVARKLDLTLLAEQRRVDFRPAVSGPDPPLDTPTDACYAACAVLREVAARAKVHLHGSNLTAFLAEARLPDFCDAFR